MTATVLCYHCITVCVFVCLQVTPSVFTQEMLQSTEERLRNTSSVHLPLILERFDWSNTTHPKLSLVHMELPLFQPYPSELVFQNFAPSQTYQLPLLLLNNDKVSRKVKLEHQNSENFIVVGTEDVCCKVAPGMAATFTVFFTPQENKDYDHRLVCLTERERFEIPIRAIGPRAILDFRDELLLPACAVKATTEKTHLVRNIGNAKARFKLQTQRPFSVTPSSGILEVGESMQVTVVFHPMTVGVHQQDLRLHYDTGEDVDIRLCGSCEELNIHLEPYSVTLKKTYITMANVQIVSLTNHSDIPLEYCWTVWPTQQDEDLSSLRKNSVLPQGEEEQQLLQCESDPASIHPLPVLSKALQECRTQAAEDNFLISPLSCITIDPMLSQVPWTDGGRRQIKGREAERQREKRERRGEIWPNTTAKFNIVFKPEEAKLYQHTLYCDVTGRESRLPLTINGEGLGPKLQLSYDQMDIGNVFIGEKVHYEVQMSNKGLIDAHFRCLSPDTTFGRCFSFNPEEGVVPFGVCQIVKVTFDSRILGNFSEDLLLTVTGQPQPVTLTFRGCVTGPTFHFNVYELNFGDVAFGFPVTLTCTLFNTSFVPMTFALRVLGDGLGSPSVSFDKHVSDLSRKKWKGYVAQDFYARPVEFTVSPAAGSVRAMSDVNIKVTLCSNTVKTYRLALVMDVQGVGDEIMTLPINARCVVPQITAEPLLLDFQRCFLGLPYEGRVRLTNSSNLPACYGMLDQENDESLFESFGSPVPRGVILPDTSEELPLLLVTKTVGRLHHTLRIAVFGSLQEPLVSQSEVELLVIGQGPVVHVQSTQLHFSKIPVLTDVTRTLQLFNRSPIPAHFNIRMSGRRSFWRVEPNEGEVPPKSQLELKVVAHLKDTLRFEDKLEISIQDSQSYTVRLSATGIGTTIVSDRPFGPTLDLGTHFSHGSCQYLFKLTNQGQRVHRLYWKFDSILICTKKQKWGNFSQRAFLPPISNSMQRDIVDHGSSLSYTKAKPVFTISPCRVELFPGCSVDMVVTAFSDSPKVVKERLVCRGIIGNQGCQETIMSVDVTCCFVAPVISISSEKLKFSVKKVKGESLLPLYEKLVLKNVSFLSLTLDLLLVEPFFLCEAPGDHTSTTTKSLILGVSGQVEVWVGFNPAFYQDRVSQIVDEYLEIHYKGHPQQHIVELHAEVHYPNLCFSSNVVDFGCVVKCTETHKVITITNCSTLPVSYRWAFLDNCKHTDVRSTDVLQKSQKILEGQVEERRSSSSTPSPDVLLSVSPGPYTNEQSSMPHPVGVEEVFDILPISGHLQPKDQQLVTFSFFGYENISRDVVAQCQVEEGPTYKIKLRGEASVISYSLESNCLDFGVQLFHCVGKVDVTLRNTGKVGFKYSIIHPQSEEDEEAKADEESGVQIKALQREMQLPDVQQQHNNEKQEKRLKVRPGWPTVIPAVGYVNAGAEQRLRVLYLPGVPEVFIQRLQLRVAFLPPEEITLTGVGVFPRITLNLPRHLLEECYSDVMQQAEAAVEAKAAKEEFMNGISAGGGATTESTWTLTVRYDRASPDCSPVSPPHRDLARNLWSKEIRESAPTSQAVRCTCSSPVIEPGLGLLGLFKNEELLHMEIDRLLVKNNALTVSGSLLELYDSRVSSSHWHKLSEFKLPQYVLDFGFVLPGKIVSRTVKVINSGLIPASFHADCRCLTGTGFTVELERVKNLPCHETHTFKVTFDPQGAKLKMGNKSVVLPIEVPEGPLVQVWLRAVVTMPAITVSTDMLQFDTLQCSMCQIKTIQLLNHQSVLCHWSIAEEAKPLKKVDKFLLQNDRKKISKDQQQPPPVFEIIPYSGVLHPSEQINVHIKFSPAEGCTYSRRLEVHVAGSTQRVFITAKGQGEEPQLEFCPSVLELGPCLPLSTDTEAQVAIKNPCSFPIEFYCLEFDTQHLEEEKILRLMQGYDEKNVLLLPPRVPGVGLPQEVLDYYNDYCSQLTSNELNIEMNEDEAKTHETRVEDMKSKQNNSQTEIKTKSVKPTEIYTSNTSAALARHYRAACLSVDAMVIDMLQSGASSFRLSARQVDHTSTAEYAQRTAVETDPATEDSGCKAPHKALDPNLVSHDTLDALAKHEEENNYGENDAIAHPEGEHTRDDFCLEGNVSKVRHSLPKQLLIDILAKRLQLSDCQHGVVIDGLYSVYTEFASSTLQVLLKAIGNRKHIYVVNLSDSNGALKARERAQEEAEYGLQSKRAGCEEGLLQGLDEEEYDALPQDEKEHINQQVLETLRMQKHRELEQMTKEKEEKKEEEETSQLLKDDLWKNGKKEGKEETIGVLRKKSLLEGKQCSVDELQSQFNKYEESQVQVSHVLQHWDRAQGLLLGPFPSKENSLRLCNVSGETCSREKQVLDDLGFGPSGPLIPPPITFSVVPFPTHRDQPNVQQTCFTFLCASGQDEDEKQKDLDEDTYTSLVKDASTTASKNRSKANEKKSSAIHNKERKGKESQKSKTAVKRLEGSFTPLPTVSNLELRPKQRLTTFRWVVPASSEVVLKIRFYSESPGTFEQAFNFELVGTRRLYKLTCQGLCTYPSICKDYMTLFANSNKMRAINEGLQKSYIIEPGYFEFGHLLCSKTRDRYKEIKYPENTEKLVIHNNSGLEAEVQFVFQHDTQATTYLLDPPTMILKPDQKQELMVWAYPTKQGQMKDCIVCHIKDNPEPVIIHLSCWGVQPQLELESRNLQFGRVLLYRRDSCSMTMHNKTTLPVSWGLHGVEELGDEFEVPQDQGIIPPNASFVLTIYIKARRPLYIKKILRLEVSDVEKILGIVQTENIQVTAEAYSVDLKISPDGCLDFGTIRVFEEASQSLRLKNKGKYEVSFKFKLEQTDPAIPNLESIFTVSPQSGHLIPNEKPTQVNIFCRPDKEIFFREQPVWACQVYKISPLCNINFGPLVYGCKKNQSFTIQNNGVVKMEFTISPVTTDPAVKPEPGSSDKTIDGDNISARLTGECLKAIQPSSLRDPSIPQNHLTVGVFTVSPCTGSLQPGSKQLVTVECAADQLGTRNTCLLINISDRDPSDQPGGIPYRLLAEVCKPEISLDMASIFEEHHLCHNSSQLSSEQFCNADSIYVLDENKFIFNKVRVKQTAQARFKLTNSSKVPCTLRLAITCVGAVTSRNVDVFHLPAATLSIPNQSHEFVAVTFTPQTMQQYSAVFEAAVEGLGRMTPTFKSKVLEFQLIGEGTLPSVCVVRPALRDSRGSPILQFRRVLVGRRSTLPLVLLNDGTVPSQVHIDLLDEHGVFTLKGSKAPGNAHCSIHFPQRVDTSSSERQLVHRSILRLNVNESVEFEISFCSDKPLSVRANMSVRVMDNQYSNTMIQVMAEAYQQLVSLDNISSSLQIDDQYYENEGNYEVLQFGDCHIGCLYQESFTMTNHSSTQAVRFEWPPSGPCVVFSPQLGHLHAGCSKEVTVSFRTSQPVTLKNQPMRCKVCQVEFPLPVEQVADWDDRQKTVQWQSSSKQHSEESQQPSPVVKTDPEPICTAVEGSQWELDLRISAVCDFVKFSCSTNTISFKDTMLFQTRLHQLHIENVGKVKLQFSWEVFIDSSNNTVNPDEGGWVSTSRPVSRTGARPSSALARVMSLLVGNPDLHPFSVEPSLGTIDPGATQNFTIRFSPVDVAQFQGRLLCRIPNLLDGDQSPCIRVCGRSLLPHCHIELEDSDYINSKLKFRSLLDPNTRVLEFKGVGFAAPVTRRFNVMNPTSKTYSFKWRCEDKSTSHFRCLTSCGTILPGNKAEMSFEYVADQQDTVESRWSFVIETLSLTIPFLCVGTAREPIVYLDIPHLDFGELLIGDKVERTMDLVSREEVPFSFSVLQSSLLSEDQQSRVILKPMAGTVAPKERLPLSVSFTAFKESQVNFRVNIKVKRKAEPLTLSVKASCFAMSTSVQVEKPDGGLREIAPNHKDTLNFEEVGISEQSTFKFLVSNLSRYVLEVNFEVTGPKQLLQYLKTRPKSATIEVGKQLQSSVSFCPLSICNLQNIILIVKVKYGPAFTFNIKGKGVLPSLDFSFTKFNFGKCFLYNPGMSPPSQALVISNKGKRDISIQCLFKNTDFLEVDFQPDILSHGAVMEVPISFYPRDPCRYQENITFILNSCVTKQVDILGQGIEMKLEVEDLSQKKVKLGTLALGQKVKKQVFLVNHSRLDVCFSLTLNTKPPLNSKDLSFSPAGELKLRSSGGSCKVKIQFSPQQYIPPFTAELQADFAGLLHPLLTIQGCCQDVKVRLDQDQLSFGAVVQRCQTVRKIVMMNTGDIGGRFHWKTENFPAELSITPEKGYICPGMEVPFEVTFAPVDLSNESRYENLSCFVEGSSKLVTLTVTGSCIAAATSKEVVHFVCPVRSSQTQTLSIVNPTKQRCNIRPVIEGDQWSAALFVNFEPHQNKTFDITYRPLTMTVDDNKHLGSVFFSFPGGNAMLYSLQGTADPPKPEDTLVHQLPAKTHHSELLTINNWLSRQQRFHVMTKIVVPDKQDTTVSLSGLKYIDVPAQGQKDYKISFFAYKEGQYNTKVTFHNEGTGEYLFYLITFKVTSPGALSTIKLVTAVRHTASATIQVENPLTAATRFTTECKCPDISAPTELTVPGQSKGVFSFKYHPLHAGESAARLSLFSNDLGYFHYDLLLKALPPPPEKTVHFNASLGSSCTMLVKFINYSHSQTEYSCKIDHPDFMVSKSVSALPGFPSGSEVSVEVCFEPHQLGEARGQFTLTSASGGEYIFPLLGVCLPPKAQGPISIKAGLSATIPFKNVFLQNTAFSFQVDNPCFSVKGTDSIQSKKTQNIKVSFQAPPGGTPKEQWFGRLIISSQRSEGYSKPCSWVYYLNGHLSESA
ncbi:hydrocephalus-inducing protein homolog [Xenentodon cancila]